MWSLDIVQDSATAGLASRVFGSSETKPSNKASTSRNSNKPVITAGSRLSGSASLLNRKCCFTFFQFSVFGARDFFQAGNSWAKRGLKIIF